MRIPATLTIAHIERLLAQIAGHRTDIAATLPTHSRYDVGGGEPAAAQLLITWAQAQRRAKLVTYATSPEDNQLQHISRQLFGLCAALLCDEATSRDGTDVRAALRRLALDRLEVIQGENPRSASRGLQVEIISADHVGRPAPRLLYDVLPDGSAFLKGRPAFLDLARLAIKTAVPEGYRDGLPSAFAASLAGALYELFRNTDEHARLDAIGNQLTRSIRGIQIRHHSLGSGELAEIVSQSRALADYVGRLSQRDNHRVQLLEISVFDSGAGLGPRWTRTPLADLGANDELNAIHACFEKHASSKSAASAGLGLPTVIDILRQRGGFLRLRTGRFGLFADLGLERDKPYDQLPDLHHWHGERQVIAPAAGTLLTLLLPLEERR